jgi:hypothetical protein
MPRLPINYANTVIYKIQHKNDKNLLYVGHTTDFIKRKADHKKNVLYDLKKSNVYNLIRDNGGWDMFDMIQLEEFPCLNKREAEKRENDVMHELKASMNSIRSFISDEQKKEEKHIYNNTYRIENSERLKKKDLDYYYNNKDNCLQKRQEYYTKNKSKLLEQFKIYRETNKDKMAEYQKEYRKNNKERIAKQRHDNYIKNKKINTYIKDD